MGQGHELVEPAVLTPPAQTSQTEHSLALLAVELLRILRHPAAHGSIPDGTWAVYPGRTPSWCYNMFDHFRPNMRSPSLSQEAFETHRRDGHHHHH
jgi:hypothetical protein